MILSKCSLWPRCQFYREQISRFLGAGWNGLEVPVLVYGDQLLVFKRTYHIEYVGANLFVFDVPLLQARYRYVDSKTFIIIHEGVFGWTRIDPPEAPYPFVFING
jgi:hypothetical protein